MPELLGPDGSESALVCVTVRTVITADGIEFHADECEHRIPRRADVIVKRRELEFLRLVDEESVALGAGRPVKPCLRRLL